MIHKIYSLHEKQLLEHEKAGMKKLRVEIHRILKKKTNFKVTIYLDKLGSVTITDGKEVLNDLVVQFKGNSDINYVWEERKSRYTDFDFYCD